jgi:hypothetical protein
MSHVYAAFSEIEDDPSQDYLHAGATSSGQAHVASGKVLIENMPRELRELDRWVCWKEGKVPYCPDQPTKKASPTDPSTWGSHSAAYRVYTNGGCLGVGFVLGEARIAGVDMDDCVDNGVPRPEALMLMERIGCKYIEFSPSGNGLRGFGYADSVQGTRGVVDGVEVELYTDQRYMTVTGICLLNGGLVELDGFFGVAQAIRKRERLPESLSFVTSVSSVSSVSSVTSVGQIDFPPSCLPGKPGQRNQCIFQLARYLKGLMPEASRGVLLEIVRSWHAHVLPNIGTPDFEISWSDFRAAWESVQSPYGYELDQALKSLPVLPNWPILDGYGEKARHLLRICWALQIRAGDEAFFLAVRQAGPLIGMHFTDAAKVLNAFEADSLLALVSKGQRGRASRYFFVMPRI